MEKINQFFQSNKKLLIGIFSLIMAGMIITIYLITTQKTITIAGKEDQSVTVYGYATIADALKKADIELSQYDQLSAPLDTELKGNFVVCIYEDALQPEIKTPSAFQKIQTVETPNGIYSYKTKMDIQATAYSPETCWPYDGTTTANGSSPKEYHTIAAPKNIPFGTLVYIPYFKNAENGGIFRVEDRGGAIKGNIIDVFFDTYQEAVHFGRRNMTMYILE